MPIFVLCRIKTTAVRALVKVKIGSIRASNQAMPEGQAYMCWIKRNGRARGTDLVRSKLGEVEFNETVKISPITLYRMKDGTYQAKPYTVEIIRNDASREAPGKVFGRVSLDLSKNFEMQRCRVSGSLLCGNAAATKPGAFLVRSESAVCGQGTCHVIAMLGT